MSIGVNFENSNFDGSSHTIILEVAEKKSEPSGGLGEQGVTITVVLLMGLVLVGIGVGWFLMRNRL